MGAVLLAVLLWITVTGPDKQPIELNAREIVSIRPPRSQDHFGAGVRCLIHTADGKYITVIETCAAVNNLLAHPD